MASVKENAVRFGGILAFSVVAGGTMSVAIEASQGRDVQSDIQAAVAHPEIILAAGQEIVDIIVVNRIVEKALVFSLLVGGTTAIVSPYVADMDKRRQEAITKPVDPA